MVKIPNRLEDLFPAAAVEKVLDALQQPDLSHKVREALGKVGLREVNPLGQVQQAWQLARGWLESMATDADFLEQESVVLNATGQLIDEALGRVPFSPIVARSLANAAAKYQNRDAIAARVASTARNVFEHRAACWECSTQTALHSLIGSRRVLVAKSDLVRIPGLGDVGAMLEGLRIDEVGAANRCAAEDWRAACNGGDPDADCLLLVSPNGLQPAQAAQDRQEAIESARRFEIPVFELLADGMFHAQLANDYGFPEVRRQFSDGVQAVVVPLHLLIGGPRGSLTLGSESQVGGMQRRADLSGNSLVGAELLAANMAVQINALGDDLESGPTAHLSASPDNLKDRAHRLAIQLHDNGIVKSARETARTAFLGPPPWDKYTLHNWGVACELDLEPAESLRRLLAGRRVDESTEKTENQVEPTPIAAALSENQLFLDVRFIDPKDDHRIVMALSNQRAHDSTTPPSAEEAPDT